MLDELCLLALIASTTAHPRPKQEIAASLRLARRRVLALRAVAELDAANLGLRLQGLLPTVPFGQARYSPLGVMKINEVLIPAFALLEQILGESLEIGELTAEDLQMWNWLLAETERSPVG